MTSVAKQTGLQTQHPHDFAEYAAWLEWSSNCRRSCAPNLLSAYVDPRVAEHMAIHPSFCGGTATTSTVITTSTTCAPPRQKAQSKRFTNNNTNNTIATDTDMCVNDDIIKMQEQIWQQIQAENLAKKSSKSRNQEYVQEAKEGSNSSDFSNKADCFSNCQRVLTENVQIEQVETASLSFQQRMTRKSGSAISRCEAVKAKKHTDKSLKPTEKKDGDDDPLAGLQKVLLTQFHGRSVKLIFPDQVNEAHRSGQGFLARCFGCGVTLKCANNMTMILCPRCGTLARSDAIVPYPDQ